MTSGLRKAPNMHFLKFSNKRRRYEMFSEGSGSSILLSTVFALEVSVSGEVREEILSCVARTEPRNRLCGMTVAPRIPTANIEV